MEASFTSFLLKLSMLTTSDGVKFTLELSQCEENVNSDHSSDSRIECYKLKLLAKNKS